MATANFEMVSSGSSSSASSGSSSSSDEQETAELCPGGKLLQRRFATSDQKL